MQGGLTCQKPNDGERYIYVGDGKKIEVEAIENFRLLLMTRFYLDLDETFIVSSFRWNLIHDSKLAGSSSLSGDDNLYMLDTIASFNESL